jgi:isochorismate synthase
VEELLLDTAKKKIILDNVSLKNMFHLAIDRRLGTAVWRNPEQQEIHIIVNFSKGLHEFTHPNLEQVPAGFLVSPYENDNNLLYYYIYADLHIVFAENGSDILDYRQNIPLRTIKDFLGKSNLIEENKAVKSITFSENLNVEKDKKEFKDLVSLSINKIAQGEFHKVVPSRIREIDLEDHFDVVAKFIRLCNKHPKAFVSLFHLPEKGIWIGASPELLVKIYDKKWFQTSALAGTQSGEHITNLSEVAWTQKEIEEQAFVGRYIINCFKKIRLREFEESGPKTVKAGGLVHLRTDYQVDLEKVNFPQLGTVMLKLLHPTSAVCGMPKDPASVFLKNHEKIDREFFGGYLGPVNIDSTTGLYVNLRCAKIMAGRAILYAGAGVTRDSDPEKEWKETELKMSTIRDALLS